MAILSTSWTVIGSASQTINGAKLTYILEAQLTSQSVSENKSYINTRARTTLNAYASMSSYNWGFSATGCTSRSGSGIYHFANETVLTGSTVVSHNEDGTGSLTMLGNAYGDGIGLSVTASGSIQLPTIARASKATANPDPLVLSETTNQLVVNTNRASSDFTHTVTLAFGSWSSTQTDVGASTTFSVPKSLISQMSATQETGTITTTTYNGETQIGASTVSSWTLAVDTDAEHPVIGTVTLSDTNAATSAVEASGSFIKGASNLRAVISFSVAGSYTTLASATVSAGGQSRTYELSGKTGSVTYDHEAIASSPLTISVTDSRGYTVTKTQALTLIPYEPVSINSVQIYRSNASGEPSEAGAYIHYSVEVRCYDGTFGGSSGNSVKLYEAHKLATDADYGTDTLLETMPAETAGQVVTYTAEGVAGGSFSASGQYSIKFTVSDLFSSANGAADLMRGIPIVSWSEDRFCVYGELCVHDKEDTSKHLTITPDIPAQVEVSFSGASGGSVVWNVFQMGSFVIATTRWRSANNATVSTAWGRLYTSAAQATPDFPVAFSDVTFADIRYVAGDSGANHSALTVTSPQVPDSNYKISGTNLGSVWLARPDSGNTIGHPVYVQTVIGIIAD